MAITPSPPSPSPAPPRPLIIAAKDVLAELRRIPAAAWIAAALAAALLGVAYKEPIKWMADRWFAPESYYSHGFLVPLVTIWLVWRDRARLASLPAGGHLWGFLAILAGLFVLLVSGILKVYGSGAFSLILVLWGLCGFLFGRRVMLRLAFPAFVLTFMVALPLAIIEGISFTLKMLATKAAVALVSALGIIALNDGAKIYLENGAALTVGNACSGLRSLISFLFLGVLFAYITDLSLPRRAILFLSSVPIAVLTNILRVFTLCMVAYTWGEDAVAGAVHDGTGYMVFIVAFGLLYLAERLLSPRTKLNAECGMRNAEFSGSADVSSAPLPSTTPAPPSPNSQLTTHNSQPSSTVDLGHLTFDNSINPQSSIRNPQLIGLRLRAAVALFILALTALGSYAMLYPEIAEQGNHAGQLPLQVGVWTGYDSPVEDYVKQILETDDIVERSYLSPAHANAPVVLAVVFSSNNRRVAHPPEICYRAGGFEVTEKRIMKIDGLPPLMRLIMDNTSHRRDVIYYFYKSGPQIEANYYRQQFNIAVNQLLRRATASSLIRFSTTVRGDEDQAAAERRLLEFIRLMVPEIQKSLN